MRAAPGGPRGRGSSRGCPRPRPDPARLAAAAAVPGEPREPCAPAPGTPAPPAPSVRPQRADQQVSLAVSGPRASSLSRGAGVRSRRAAGERSGRAGAVGTRLPGGCSAWWTQHRCCLRGSPLSRCTAPPARGRGLSSRRCDPGLTTRRSLRTALCRVAGSSGSEPGVPRRAGRLAGSAGGGTRTSRALSPVTTAGGTTEGAAWLKGLSLRPRNSGWAIFLSCWTVAAYLMSADPSLLLCSQDIIHS